MSNSIQRKNILILAACQAIAITGNILIFSVSALAALEMVENKAYATIPLFLQYLSGTLSTIPASLIMKKFGRKRGFMLGLVIASLGGGIAYLAVNHSNFYLFCLGSSLLGVFLGFAPYYRFAAVDSADDNYKNKAISLVVAGGVVAAFIGPALADFSVNLYKIRYSGNFFVLILLPFISLILLNFINIPQVKVEEQAPKRSLGKILKQRRFLLAMTCAMIGYGVMSLLMVATPLSMKHYTLSFNNITLVIQWHVLGMFAPSFFTGHLIQRFGLFKILIAGSILNFLCVVINLLGQDLIHYLLALLCLGIGWNFLYVGGSSLLTETYHDSEKAVVQGINEFFVLLTVSFSSMTSGFLFATLGWQVMNLVALLAIVPIFLFSIYLPFRKK